MYSSSQVLKDGEIVEFDKPHILLQNQDSLFFKLVSQTGKTEAEYLIDIAMEAKNARDRSEEPPVTRERECDFVVTRDIDDDDNDSSHKLIS